MPIRQTTPAGVCILLLVLACGRCAGDEPPAPPAGGLFAPVWASPTAPEGDAAPARREAPLVSDFNPWTDPGRPDSVPRTAHGAASGDWGSLTANSVLGDASSPPEWEDPQQQRAWKTNGDWRCPVVGPVFVFGQFGGNGTEVAQKDTKVSGQTGLGCKWAPVEEAEFVVRSGPSLTYTDPLRPDNVRERSEWLLEVQAHWAIMGKIGLEYQGKAAPALTPLDHDWMDQDLGLAAPICTGGKVRVGARHHWDDAPQGKAATDGTQLYFGLELAR